MERQNNAGVEAGDLADDARLVAHAPRVDPREPLAVLSGTYRRNRPRRVRLLKWTSMHIFSIRSLRMFTHLHRSLKILMTPRNLREILTKFHQIQCENRRILSKKQNCL